MSRVAPVGISRRLSRCLAVTWMAVSLGAGAASAQPGRPSSSGLVAVRGQGVTVRHAPEDSLVARAILHFLEGQPPLPGLPPLLPSRVDAVLAPDEGSFERFVGRRSPEWVGGVAIPSRGMLVLPMGSSVRTMGGDRLRVLRHEWAHLGLHEHLSGLRVPRWFDEGYAEWAAGWDASQTWKLRLLLGLGRTPPLDSLELRWPRDAASARAAYLLSATALEYLVRESGERGLGIFLERWREVRSFEEALRTTYGVTESQFEEDWREYVKDRYGWLLFITQSLVSWTMLGVLLLVLVRVRRVRDRERMARMRAQEVPEAPAYWMAPDGPRSSEGEDGG